MQDSCFSEKDMLPSKDLFCRVRQFYFGANEKPLSAAEADTRDAADYIAAIRREEAALAAFTGECPRLLLRCLGMIKTALTEKNYRMAGDLSDVGIRLCDVFFFPFLSRRAFVKQAVRPFEDRHECAFFAAEGEDTEAAFLAGRDTPFRLRPFFGRDRHAGHYAEGDYDAEFRAAHPALYRCFLALGLLLFFGAFVLYWVLAHRVFGKDGALLVLGYIGAGALGTGLFSLLLSFIRQYMGHVLTALLLGGGLCLAALPLLIL